MKRLVINVATKTSELVEVPIDEQEQIQKEWADGAVLASVAADRRKKTARMNFLRTTILNYQAANEAPDDKDVKEFKALLRELNS